MAKREVVETECDRCHVIEETPMKTGRGQLPIPAGWLQIVGNTRTKLVFHVDLCGKCKVPVLAAGGLAAIGART
jgi:hypothetical protein